MKINIGDKTLFDLDTLIPFLYGVLATNNIVYLFVVGNTPIMLTNFVAFLIIVLTYLTNSKKVVLAIRDIPIGLKIWCVCALLSVVQVLIYHPTYLYQWFVGIIEMALNICVLLMVLIYRKKLDDILKGVSVGLIFNFVRIGYELLNYRMGKIANFSEIYPYSDILVNYIGNAFRGEGFFREPGHLMRFTVLFAIPLIVIAKRKSKVAFYLILIIIGSIFASTLSASLLIFVFGLIIYFIFAGNMTSKQVIKYGIGIFLITTIIVVAYFNVGFIKIFLDRLLFSTGNAFAEDKSNSTRLMGMSYALTLIKEYPILGSGWNTLTPLFKKFGFYGKNTVLGSYSYALTLFEQLGLGAVAYFYFMIKNAVENLKCHDELSVAFGASMIMAFFMTISTDFTFYANSAFFFGVCFAYTKNLKNSEEKFI